MIQPQQCAYVIFAILISMQALGALSILILTFGLIVIPVAWPLDIKHTFSQHVARHKASITYYIALFSVFLVAFSVFYIGWFIPTLQLPFYTSILYCVAMITQYTCTFIPEIGGMKSVLHRILAATSAFTLIPLTLALLTIPSPAMRVTVLASVSIMIILPIIFLHKRLKRYLGESYLIQALYYAAFFTPVLIATYTQS